MKVIVKSRRTGRGSAVFHNLAACVRLKTTRGLRAIPLTWAQRRGLRECRFCRGTGA